jgi:quinolinate synthase
VLKFDIKNVKLEHFHAEEIIFQVSDEHGDQFMMAQRCLNVREGV